MYDIHPFALFVSMTNGRIASINASFLPPAISYVTITCTGSFCDVAMFAVRCR